MRPKDFHFCFFDKCLGGVAQSTSGLLRQVTPALFRSLATKTTSRCSSLVYALLKTQQTAPERKRNASEADKRQANKEKTIVIYTAGGSTCPAATRLQGKPGLLHTSHCTPFSTCSATLFLLLEVRACCDSAEDFIGKKVASVVVIFKIEVVRNFYLTKQKISTSYGVCRLLRCSRRAPPPRYVC